MPEEKKDILPEIDYSHADQMMHDLISKVGEYMA
jgi:hypothetical protein